MDNLVKLDQLCINTIRMLAIDSVEKAKSGHPGMPLGAAPMAYALWSNFLRHSPKDPNWLNRDRFILAAGHGSALLYALLHLFGYDLPLEELKSFRQLGSLAPGHPERGLTPGVEVTSGPLGQGFAMGVGMALAERFMGARFNRPDFPIVDHNIYAILSDGDLMEGITSEAASLAGHLCLGKLIYLYDDNKISIEGSTSLSFTEDVYARFKSYGWHVQRVEDGNDIEKIFSAIEKARQNEKQPSLIGIRTHIGYGSPKQDSSSAHGEPLGTEALRATKEKLGWPQEPAFYIPAEAKENFERILIKLGAYEDEWNELFQRYKKSFPKEAELLLNEIEGDLPVDWKKALPSFEKGEGLATRISSGKVINSLAKVLPNFMGGSADLAPSNKSYIAGAGDVSAKPDASRNIHFGVREHAMGAIVNGLALHGGILPYGSTFLVFSDYMRPAIRLAALMQAHSIFIFTHDSIGVGEDGPTHQPIEHIMALRMIPNLVVIRPADANETAFAWKIAVERKGPSVLLLTRQDVPTLNVERSKLEEGMNRGAYIIADCDGTPDMIFVATGSEVHLAMGVKDELMKRGSRVRVVSMPSWELFEKEDKNYKEKILPKGIKKVSVEAGITLGWERWVESSGTKIGIDSFGISAPCNTAMKKFGFSIDGILNRVLAKD